MESEAWKTQCKKEVTFILQPPKSVSLRQVLSHLRIKMLISKFTYIFSSDPAWCFITVYSRLIFQLSNYILNSFYQNMYQHSVFFPCKCLLKYTCTLILFSDYLIQITMYVNQIWRKNMGIHLYSVYFGSILRWMWWVS